ncbi:hypothetical protein BH11PSE2_BH11PSE2_16300 [soil metagenome]
MRQFDVCSNPSERSRAYAPFVIVLQSHLLDAMPTVIVAPMIHADRAAYTKVAAQVTFDGVAYSISVAELAVIERRKLATVGNLFDAEY